VILAYFMAALRDPIANTLGLSVGAHVDMGRAIVRNLCFLRFLIMLFLLISLRLRLSCSVIIAS